VLGEVLEALDRLESEAPDECQRGVAHGGEHLWSVAGVGARLILAAGDIADVVQFVLDAPMLARQGEQTFRSSFIRRQAGDGINPLDAGLAMHDTLSGEAANLSQTRPGRSQVLGQRGSDLHSAGLDPAMALLDRLSLPQVRRRSRYR